MTGREALRAFRLVALAAVALGAFALLAHTF